MVRLNLPDSVVRDVLARTRKRLARYQRYAKTDKGWRIVAMDTYCIIRLLETHLSTENLPKEGLTNEK